MASNMSILQYLQKFSLSAPSDAIALRSASAQIISKWMKCGFDIQDDMILPIVYIESSIEDSIADKLGDAVALEAECADAYKFHIQNFLEAVKELKNAVERSKAR